MTVAHQKVLKRLASKFVQADRFANFGHCLEALHVRSMRGISDVRIDFRFPISVICGPNGSGKSTFAHTALCVFRKPNNKKSFNINQFFFQSDIDKNLFTDESEVFAYYTFPYTATTPPTRYNRIYRNIDRWRGYDRRPFRGIIYIGLLVYLPKVERRDLSVYARTRLKRGLRTPIDDGARLHINRILGSNSSAIDIQKLHDSYREIDVFCVSRGAAAAYSESNMGLGEGRVIKMVVEIENAPPKSLIVIDEPEIALHEAAQGKFAQYLADASDRLGHQFILTSHSPALISELPSDALIYIERRGGKVVSVEGATYKEAKALLTSKAYENTIWVEDETAKSILENLLRRIDPSLIASTKVSVLTGGEAGIRSAMKSLSKLNIGRIAVLDADQKPSEEIGILSLPGSMSPEKEIFACPDVIEMLLREYGVTEDQIDDIREQKDSHSWFFLVSKECCELIENIKSKCILAYVRSIDEKVVEEFGFRLRARLEAIKE